VTDEIQIWKLFQLNFYIAPAVDNYLQNSGKFLRNGMKWLQEFRTLDA